MKAVKKIEISVLHKRITPIVYAVQGDTGREIECTVVDWDIPAGVTARVWVVKPSKKVVYNDCRIVNKAVFVPMTNQTLAEPGGAICMIEFVSGEDVVSSFSFNLYVYESVSGDGIESNNESTVLEKMFEELAQDAIKTLNEAKAQAAAAKKSAQDTEKIKNDFTLTAQQAVADVNNAGQTQTQRVNTAGDTQVSRIQAEGTTQVQNVQATAAEISEDREQIHTNRDNTARLQRTTAGAIMRSAEGSFVTLEDAADEMGFSRIEIPGETRQRITTGAQLFDASTIIENVVTPNFMPIQLKPNTEYTLSSDTAKDYDGPGAYLFIASGNHTSGSFTTANDGVWKGNPRTVTSDANGYVTIIYKQKVNGYLKNANIMLNAGSTALPWEPYTGNKPSPSPEYPQELENVGRMNKDGEYEVKVHSSGAQLLKLSDVANATRNGMTYSIHNSVVTVNGTPSAAYASIVSGQLTLLPGTYYVAGGETSPGHVGLQINVTKANGEVNFCRNQAFTIDGTERNIAFAIQCSSDLSPINNYTLYPMLNAGDTPLPCVPYRASTATITSDRPLTKWDKLTCRDGVWGWAYRGTKYICSLNEVISQHGASIGKKYPCMTFSMKGKARDAGEVCACNYLKSVGSEVLNGNAIGIWGNTNPTYKNYVYIGIPYSVLGTTIDSTADENATAMTAWLNAKKEAGAPVTIEYKLAEEEWVPLSAEEQAAMNALCTYAGTTHIWTDDPLQPVISLDYTVDTEGYIRETAPAYRDVERFALTGEASGTVATCTDSADWPLLGVGMLGKCEQVSTTGAQLLECADTEKVSNGTKLSITNGNVHLTGTATGSGGRLALIVGTATLIPGTYTLCASEKTNCKSIMCVTDKSNTESMIASTSENLVGNVVFTLAQKKEVIIGINVGSGIQYNESFKVMLNAGETALPWEPYTGAAPSPSPAYKQEIQETGTYNPETGMYEAVWQQCGDNIFDMDAWYEFYYAFKRDIFWETIDGRKCLKWRGSSGHGEEYKIFPLRINKGHKIRFSFYSKKQVVSGHNDTGMYLWGKDGTNILGLYTTDTTTWTYIEKEIVLKEDCYGMIMAFSYNDYCYFSDISLTVDSDNTEYQPYQSGTLRLTADQPWRGIGDVHDEVCDRDGVLGTLRRFGAMEYNTAALHFANPLKKTKELRINPPQGALLDSKKKTICDKFRNLKDGTWNKDVAYVYGDAGVNGEYIAFRVDINENPETFFVDNPIKFVYQLATPVWEPFPEEIQKQYRKLKSYAGTTHAWVDDPLQPEVSFRYVKDSKLILGKLEDRLTALEAGQAQTAAAFSYLPPEIQAEMIETETRELMNSI